MRQVELDVHKNNTELLILQNNVSVSTFQQQGHTRTRRRRRPKNFGQTPMERGEYDTKTDQNTDHTQCIPASPSDGMREDFLDKPSPPKVRKKAHHPLYIPTRNPKHSSDSGENESTSYNTRSEQNDPEAIPTTTNVSEVCPSVMQQSANTASIAESVSKHVEMDNYDKIQTSTDMENLSVVTFNIE